MGTIENIEDRAKIIRVLRLLAAPPNVQISYFPEFVAIPDELALEFENQMLLANWLTEHGKLAPNEYSAMQAIKSQFDYMDESNPAEIWTLDGVKNDEAWMNLRDLAHAALKAFKANYAPPGIVPRSMFRQNNRDLCQAVV